MSDQPAEDLRAVREYHARTQHHLQRYARSLGYLDWDTQPDPFRRFEGAERVLLALRAPDGAPDYAGLFAGTRDPAPVGADSIGQLFQDSLALSAWKEHGGARWALRVNPSSGNLHPTEAYLVSGPIEGLCTAPSLFHYAPDEHALERRGELPGATWRALAAALPAGALLVGLATIPWREAWKYGERALRYCMQDGGHALGALGFAAAALGWRAALLALPDRDLAALLGLRAAREEEPEHPLALVCVHPEADPCAPWARGFALEQDALAPLGGAAWRGSPNVLSEEHHDWPAIDGAVGASRLVAPRPAFWDRPGAGPRAAPPDCADDARGLFHARRSAVAMDGRTGTDAAHLLGTLARACDPTTPALALLPWRPRVHLVLFVHRVTGLPPGIYCLVRGGQDPSWLRGRMRAELLWERAAGTPGDLPLYLLVPIDCRPLARTVSCHQDIAADSAYSLAMVAEFDPALEELGAHGWRLLHWEAGALGQLLYLEAQAAGLSATGIGCFFDSAVHEALGTAGDDLRTIYHFTVGGAVEDTRLRTGPPYPGREGGSRGRLSP